MESASQAIIAINPQGQDRGREQQGRGAVRIRPRRDDRASAWRCCCRSALRETHVGHRNDYFGRPHARPMGIGMDLAGKRKNGQEFPVEISLNYVEVGGHSLAISFITDISERLRLEAAVAAIAKDGGHRPTRRRGGARLQQPADRHPGLQRDVARRPRPRRHVARADGGDREGGDQRGGAHPPIAGLQPPAGGAAADSEPEYRHLAGGEDAAARHRRGRGVDPGHGRETWTTFAPIPGRSSRS